MTAVQCFSMKTIRAFIAIEMPKNIQEYLRSVSDGLQAKLGQKSIRWLSVENIHLTLKFFKTLAVNEVEVIVASLQELLAEIAPFELKLSGLGIFPNPQRPRVIWLGVQAHPELVNLQQGILNETMRLGHRAERRPFSPHLTLGRLRRDVPPPVLAEINRVVGNQKPNLSNGIKVQEIVFFHSELKASGAVYTKLFAAELGRQAEELQKN